ncbi:hypothetical protein K8089_13410 [Aequorivita sp. F47161]|uniref:Lipoprotein n=1 Tax=Aequorivita vitellina TaxID=2874475 RepID=A0A9X1UAV5_9FLAO|nr:hypothetical protein [Aequorivita vitellina]MCG2420021.1 hypothetical protein [Aequorivita vitellina]
MSNKTINLSFLILLLLTVTSCKKDRVVEFAITEVTAVNSDYDICTSNCAVLTDKSCYNTENGTAILYMPIPKNHYLTIKKQSDNEIYFEANGAQLNQDYDIFKIRLSGLKKSPGASLFIYLDINSSNQVCASGKNPGKLGVKKKGTEISGHPILDNGCTPSGVCITR